METILFLAFVLGVASVILFYLAERFYREHSDKLLSLHDSDRMYDIYQNVYSGGIILAIATISFVILGGIYFFIKDFEAEAFKNQLLILASMIFILFGAIKISGADVYRDRKDAKQDIYRRKMYEGLLFMYIGLFFIVATLALSLLSLFD